MEKPFTDTIYIYDTNFTFEEFVYSLTSSHFSFSSILKVNNANKRLFWNQLFIICYKLSRKKKE